MEVLGSEYIEPQYSEFNALCVARFIVKYENQNKRSVTPLRLCFLVYFVWIEYYKITKGKQLFDDNFYAWPWGSVVPDVYGRYCFWLGKPITNILPDKYKIDYSSSFYSIVSDILNDYQRYTTNELVDIAKRDDGPWISVFVEGRKRIIPFEKIIEKECR